MLVNVLCGTSKSAEYWSIFIINHLKNWVLSVCMDISHDVFDYNRSSTSVEEVDERGMCKENRIEHMVSKVNFLSLCKRSPGYQALLSLAVEDLLSTHQTISAVTDRCSIS